MGLLYGSLLFANTMKMLGTMDEKLKNHLIFRLCHMVLKSKVGIILSEIFLG